MGALLDYTLADFLLFAPETYWRLFERMNAAVWPLHPALLAVLAAVAVAAARGGRRGGLAVGMALAACWVLVAQLFLAVHYAPINWAIGWVVPLAWAQAALMVIFGRGLHYAQRGRARLPGALLVAAALLYPAFGMLAGRPLLQTEIAGLAPDPTAILGIGMVVLADRGRGTLILCLLPLAWLLFSVVTLRAMNDPMALALGVLLVAAVLAIAARLASASPIRRN